VRAIMLRSSVQWRRARSGCAMHSGAGPEGTQEAKGTHGSATRSVTLGLYRPTSRTARRVPCENHRRVRRGTGSENVGAGAAVKPARAAGCPCPPPRPAGCQTALPRAGSMPAQPRTHARAALSRPVHACARTGWSLSRGVTKGLRIFAFRCQRICERREWT
jgi:hypothetical protein